MQAADDHLTHRATDAVEVVFASVRGGNDSHTAGRGGWRGFDAEAEEDTTRRRAQRSRGWHEDP